MNILKEIPQSATSKNMRRCFMTGKQCIFRSEGTGSSATQSCNGVFVAMPYRPNFDTFYEWSLFPYLRERGIPENQIWRADKVSKTGYIMCEHICRRIQDAALVTVDLSIPNPNVFYELGISIGLGKRILPLCDKRFLDNDKSTKHPEHYWTALGLKTEVVLGYPDIGILTAKWKDVLRDKITPINHDIRKTKNESDPQKQLKQGMKIQALVHSLVDQQPDVKPDKIDDIPVDFAKAVEAGVGVAVAAIEEKYKRWSSVNKEEMDRFTANLVDAVKTLKGDKEDTPKRESSDDQVDDIESLKTCRPIPLHNGPDHPVAFDTIAAEINDAFICIIDLYDEDPYAYFWLGYCHAKGINVVPVVRANPVKQEESEQTEQTQNQKQNQNQKQTNDHNGNRPKHVLAFDIRALWYMQYDTKEPKNFADGLRAVIEELIVKDVPTQQRRMFWERLTRTGRVHIFTGAVHNGDLSREMVGDWDLRTVSELVRYIASTEESVVPELENPIYRPETIKKKLSEKKRWDDDKSMDEYVSLIKGRLQGTNCLIVASADVNPLTEVVLAHAYQNRDLEPENPECFTKTPPNERVTVALKGINATDNSVEDTKNNNSKNREEQMPRRFSLDTWQGLNKDSRGYLLNGRQVIQRPYTSQDNAIKKFNLIAHLIMTYNPFPDPNAKDAIIVLLNGVSGPGTFGLAEVLTGGTSSVREKENEKNKNSRKESEDQVEIINKAMQSEKLLKEINKLWEKESKKDEFRGIEAFIEVEIKPKKEAKSSGNNATTSEQDQDETQIKLINIESVENTFFDRRDIENWYFCKDNNIPAGNPRLLRT